MHPKHWKDWIIGIAVLIMVIMLAGCRQERTSQPPTTQQQTLKIGAVLPLSGDAAAYGQSAKSGMDLALEEINMTTSGRRFVIVYEDSKADPKIGVASFQKLVDVDRVVVVLGPLTSAEVLAVAPIAERRKVVVLSPTASAPAISEAGDYIFRNLTSDDYDGKTMAQFAFRKLKYTRCAIAYRNDDFGLGLMHAFKNEFQKLGGEITTVEALSPTGMDFRAQIQKIKATQPQAVFLVGGKEMGRFLKQSVELGLKAKFLSVAVFEDPEIISIAGGAAEGTYYTYRTYDPKAKEGPVVEFVKKYKAKYGKEPDIFAALSYDAVKIVITAISKASESGKLSGEKVKDALYEIKDFPGVTGTTTFDSKGDVIKPIGIKTVKGGEFIWVEKP